MKCPSCFFIRSVKDGIVKDRQRYKCKRCGYRYTVEENKRGTPSHLKRVALMLSLEGYPLQKIGDELGVSHTAVAKWLKADSVEALLEENTNKHRSIQATNIQGMLEFFRENRDQGETAYKQWLLVGWNSLESRVYMVKRGRPWKKRNDDWKQELALSQRKRTKKTRKTDVEFFRELLQKTLDLSDKPKERNNGEIRSALYTLTWLFEDIARNSGIKE